MTMIMTTAMLMRVENMIMDIIMENRNWDKRIRKQTSLKQQSKKKRVKISMLQQLIFTF